MGIMKKKMEATIVYWGLYIQGLSGDNGKENGNYCSTLGDIFWLWVVRVFGLQGLGLSGLAVWALGH